MDETVLKVAIAAFAHDIGKLADASVLGVSPQYWQNNADLYQPFYQGRHTHRHAVLTAAFIEHCEELLPKCLNKRQWGLEDSFINLAAGHHKPSTPLQWVIAIADRVSSGWDRAKFDDEYNHAAPVSDYQRTRLLPIFENLLRNGGDPAGQFDPQAYGYSLKEVSPDSIFPQPLRQACPENKEKAAAEYRQLFEDFSLALGSLLHKEENLPLWFEHFESLAMVYGAAVPAARAGNVIPDVSLYDHLKSTSALAVALYVYHRDTDTLDVAPIKDYDTQKILLISGDFYGIQNFIFSDGAEGGKNRSKMLRGRSFAVSLFTELAADMFCRELGLPSVCVVLNAAGKFTIIAPNTTAAREKVALVEKQINAWLVGMSYGECAIGITTIEASPQDFVSGNFLTLWDQLAYQSEKRKFQKFDIEQFGGAVPGYLDGFRNDLKRPLCPFCGKRPSSPETEGDLLIGVDGSSCKICRDHIFFGTYLVKRDRLAVTTADADLWGDEKLLLPIYERYQVAFVDGGMKDLARSGKLLKYWDLAIGTDGRVAKELTVRFVNAYVPVYRKDDLADERLLAGKRSERKKEELIELIEDGVPKTFSHLAYMALNPRKTGDGFCGLEGLGILKADVDHLGLILACGLSPEHFTVSRLATLSRQLNWFFVLYLPYQLQTDVRFADVYTVFAGGDDLFLIGPWNRIIELTGFLHEAFRNYVCHNPEIHFSAGISLHKPHTPLGQLAEEAESALGKSKHAGRNRVTLFGETATWQEFFELQAVKETLGGWLDKGLINNAMVYRLNDFISMVKREKKVLSRGEVHIDEMDCLKWRALFCYAAERNVGRGPRGSSSEPVTKQEMLGEFLQAAEWLEKFGGKLRIALWDVIYNRR